MEQMFGILEEKSNVEDDLGAEQVYLNQDLTLKFEHVSFAYKDNKNVLDDVSFEIPHKKITAIGF